MPFTTALAQSSVGNSESEAVREHFDQLYRVDSRLISGNFYQDLSPKSVSGHPFFGDKDWKIGSVTIGDVLFDSLLLKYDIANNQLVYNTLDITESHIQVSLNKKKIKTFTLDGRTFIPYPPQVQENEPQFCEVLSFGPVSLLLLQTKKLKVQISGNTKFSFETYSKMKLLLADSLINYAGKKTLYLLYPQFKEALRIFIHDEKLKLSKRHPENHARLVDYCNKLITTSE